MSDPVSAPSHYAGDGQIECMRAMKSMVHNTEKVTTNLQAYWWISAFKYLWRWPWKNGLQDLQKCRQCLDYLIEEMETK